MEAMLALRNLSEVVKLVSNASEVARGASELARRSWKILRDSKPQQADPRLGNSQSEARGFQLE